MYDYVLVFLSTMFATALVTRWLYQDELKALEALQALKAQPKAQPKEESKEEPKAPQTPINIPTLSREKHDERTRLIEQWTLKYMLKQIEEQEQAQQQEKQQEQVQAKQQEKAPSTQEAQPLALEAPSTLKKPSTQESNAVHDAALEQKHFPQRKYIYSPTILPHERTPTHLTRSMHEWWDFERQHSAAPIGEWIHYEDPKVQGETTIRVTYAILRIDAPERWEERVYFYHIGETYSAF
jgi:hypothetical protein